jgi:flagellar basal body rod protein FlgC
MAASYEATQDETDHGVKVFEIHDDTGRHPVAVVARRLTKEVADAQGRLIAPAVDVVQQVIEEVERRDPGLLCMLSVLTGMR